MQVLVRHEPVGICTRVQCLTLITSVPIFTVAIAGVSVSLLRVSQHAYYRVLAVAVFPDRGIRRAPSSPSSIHHLSLRVRPLSESVHSTPVCLRMVFKIRRHSWGYTLLSENSCVPYLGQSTTASRSVSDWCHNHSSVAEETFPWRNFRPRICISMRGWCCPSLHIQRHVSITPCVQRLYSRRHRHVPW